MQIDDIRKLVRAELDRIADPARRNQLFRLLMSPVSKTLSWDYGEPGQQLDCWRVAQTPDQCYWLVYCETGFGPSFPWGFLETHSISLGNDAQWHSGLEDAAIGCGTLPARPSYESPGPRE